MLDACSIRRSAVPRSGNDVYCIDNTCNTPAFVFKPPLLPLCSHLLRHWPTKGTWHMAQYMRSPTPQGALRRRQPRHPRAMAAKASGHCVSGVSRNLRAALRAGGIPSENGPRKGPAGRPHALAGTAPSPAGGARKCRSPLGRGPL
jgi:hypothetical protein